MCVVPCVICVVMCVVPCVICVEMRLVCCLHLSWSATPCHGPCGAVCHVCCVYVACMLRVLSQVENSQKSLQYTATHCNTLQHTATHCNTLQHTATQCNAEFLPALPCHGPCGPMCCLSPFSHACGPLSLVCGPMCHVCGPMCHMCGPMCHVCGTCLPSLVFHLLVHVHSQSSKLKLGCLVCHVSVKRD